jgi:hypothetical protein
MNKKGTIYHWIAFAIIGGIGLFSMLVYSTTSDFGLSAQGDWMNDFLKDISSSTQDSLLGIDQTAHFAGKIIVKNLSQNAGYLSETFPTCGLYEAVPLWNEADDFCFPEIKEEVNKIFTNKFNELYQGYKENESEKFNYEITMEGQDLIGVTNEGTLITKKLGTSQEVEPNFRVDLGYDFNEYQELFQEAIRLVSFCSGAFDLQFCLDEGLKENWKLNRCDDEIETLDIIERKAIFCVESKFGFVRPNYVFEPVKYQLALDFTPNGPMPAFVKETYTNNGNIIVKFLPGILADSHTIYLTNVDGRDYVGSVTDFNNQYYLSGDSVNGINIKAEEMQLTCPDIKEAGFVYVCDDELVYVTSISNYDIDRDLFVAITSVYLGEESDISGFVVVE